MKKSSQYFQWNKVTPLSKYLAMGLFVALPFTGFVLGMKYQKSIIPTVDVESEPTPISTQQKTVVPETSLPSSKPTATASPVAAVNIISARLVATKDWHTIDSGTFIFKAPTHFSFYVFNPQEVGLFNNSKPEGMRALTVKRRGQTQYGDRYQYDGGSRREWWLKEYKEDSDHGQPKFTFVEKNYGKVSGLEVSADGIKKSILVSFESRLYEFSDGSDGQFWSTLETIVSTFKEK